MEKRDRASGIESPVKKRRMNQLEELGYVLTRDGVTMDLEKLLRNIIIGYGENGESDNGETFDGDVANANLERWSLGIC